MSPTDRDNFTSLLTDYSLEITGKDVAGLREAAPVLPRGTRVNVTFLASETLEARVAAAQETAALGFLPVPHLAARRLTGEDDLRRHLEAFAEADVAERLFIIGGDPPTPLGPYASAADVIETGMLAGFGVKEVGVGGYPEGHPSIPDDELWAALRRKTRALHEQGLEQSIITQFGFDDAPVIDWIRRVREEGVAAPIRIGLPGPAGVKRLLSFARRFGVGTSAGIARKYGFSLTNLMGTAGPDRLATALASQLDPRTDGRVGVHLYTFGSVPAAASWAHSALDH